MDLMGEVKQFKNLSIKYREAYANPDDQKKIERQIKDLVSCSVERVASSFNIKLNEEKKKIIRGGKGVLMVPHTINTMKSKPMARIQDFSFLNKHHVSKANGLNILLDYSGSEWFPGKDTIDGVERIYCQNFLALCLIQYIQGISNNKIRIIVHAYSKTPLKIMDSVDTINESWDGFIMHDSWGCGHGSEGTESQRLSLAPVFLKNHISGDFLVWDKWHGDEHIKEAFEKSLGMFRKMNMNKFITLLMTDGGCTRMGESQADRQKFIEDSITLMETKSMQSKMAFVFIKTQIDTIKRFAEKIGVSNIEILNKDAYNKSFISISQLINNMIR